jgi:ABC-type phosphate/phosphonate transport system substrate-binding protein
VSVQVSSGFSFGLPPSLGFEPVKELAREFADVLFDGGFTQVVPFPSYEDLEQSLLGGETDAAWGPPIVCARVETNGGSVPFRAVRDGATSYRSVLICRQNDPIELERLGQIGARKPRAVWVDEWSMAGYILPRHYLESSGVDPEAAFSEQRMMGSYEACFNELLDGEADLTASYANRRGTAYVELCGNSAHLFRVLCYTDASPNDAVVIAPQVDTARKKEVEAGLRGLIRTPKALQVLASMFDIDGFDEPPPGSYQALAALAPTNR